VIRADVDERLKDFLDAGPFTDKERIGLLREAGKRAGWDDAARDVSNETAQCQAEW
jgi:hypothetical protein